MYNIKNLADTVKNSEAKLYIFCGLPYAGKTYLLKQWQAQHPDLISTVSLDSIFEEFGYSWDEDHRPDGAGWEKILAQAKAEIIAALSINKSVFYDSTNHTKASRDALREIADEVGKDTTVVYVKSDPSTIWARYEDNAKSPTRPQANRTLVQEVIDTFEEPTADENVLIIQN